MNTIYSLSAAFLLVAIFMMAHNFIKAIRRVVRIERHKYRMRKQARKYFPGRML